MLVSASSTSSGSTTSATSATNITSTTNASSWDLNLTVRASDERRIEVIASGLPVFGGAQLAIDVTVRSMLRCNGTPHGRAHWMDGVVAQEARRNKEDTYPELAGGGRCRLVVLAIETGGRCSAETTEFLRQLAEAKALTVSSFLRSSTSAAYQRRWMRMLAVSVVASFCESLLSSQDSIPSAGQSLCREPWLQDLLMAARAEPECAQCAPGQAGDQADA